ncbi:MAG: putative DNA binding domain-containing protein [Elusimicrobiota bacterium]|nr:putative DNA binding domain-containing protein [Elusimicrobiota bacterium]
MDKKELISRLEDIEWEDFEVKEAKSDIPKSSWSTVSAFSNTSGGWLIFGVRKSVRKYEITGVRNPEKIEQDFNSALRSGKFNKKIKPLCKKYGFSDKTVLTFYIPQKTAKDRPVYYGETNKNTFIRTGSGDQRATAEEVDSFYRQASFEEKIKELTSLKLRDLDTKTIEQFRNFFASKNPAHRYLKLRDKGFLEKMGALKNDKVTYAGLLVFGNEDALGSELVNYRIDYLEIPGKSFSDGETRYTFRLDSEKNLYMSFFDIYERLSPKIEVPFKLKNGVRDDDPPHLQALREALVNLIMHTDYFSPANARIRFFTDRIEFFNPGGLPKPLKYILKEDYSQPRNFYVAKMFRFLKLSEGQGSGFHKMINGWKKYYKKPVIESGFDYYKIVFPLKPVKNTEKSSPESSPKSSLKTEEKILVLIAKDRFITTEHIAGFLGITKRGVLKQINKLKKSDRLERIGSARGGYWQLKK